MSKPLKDWLQPPAWNHIYCLWLFNRCRITCFSFMSSQHLLPWQPQTSSAFYFYRKFKVKNWNFWLEFYLFPSWYGNILRRETKAVELFCRFWTSQTGTWREKVPPKRSIVLQVLLELLLLVISALAAWNLNECSFYCPADVLEGRIPGGFL